MRATFDAFATDDEKLRYASANKRATDAHEVISKNEYSTSKKASKDLDQAVKNANEAYGEMEKIGQDVANRVLGEYGDQKVKWVGAQKNLNELVGKAFSIVPDAKSYYHLVEEKEQKDAAAKKHEELRSYMKDTNTKLIKQYKSELKDLNKKIKEEKDPSKQSKLVSEADLKTESIELMKMELEEIEMDDDYYE